jgi:hypothetical protein
VRPFYLPNYRMGKTLGIGSFGKARGAHARATLAQQRPRTRSGSATPRRRRGADALLRWGVHAAQNR